MFKWSFIYRSMLVDNRKLICELIIACRQYLLVHLSAQRLWEFNRIYSNTQSIVDWNLQHSPPPSCAPGDSRTHLSWVSKLTKLRERSHQISGATIHSITYIQDKPKTKKSYRTLGEDSPEDSKTSPKIKIFPILSIFTCTIILI